MTSRSDSDSVGRRVQSRRAELGVSRAVLAEQAGVSPKTLKALENGAAVPGVLEVVERLARALDTPVPTLLYGEDAHDNRMNTAVDEFANENGLSVEETSLLREMVFGERHRNGGIPTEEDLKALLRYIDNCPKCGASIDVRREICASCNNFHGLNKWS